MVYVACSGGIGGQGAPHCAPGRATRTALLAQCSPSIAVYVSAPPTARHIPLASVMGIEPISRWVWRPDRPPERTPYDSFFRTTGWGI